MLSRPVDITDEVVGDALRAGWGLDPATIAYLPVGFGSYHWLMTDSAGGRWFVTVDDLTAQWRPADQPTDATYARLRAALTTARAAGDAGARFVVAPVPGLDGDVVRRLRDRWAVAVYPHVDGRPREWGAELTTTDRMAVLDLLVALHGAPPSVSAQAYVEDFRIANRDVLTGALGSLSAPWDGGPYAEPARELLGAYVGVLDRLLDRHDRLVRQAGEQDDRLVLTHGEPHPGNLVETDAGWVLVDWDTTLVAPPERDVWMLDPGDGSIAAAYADRSGRAVSPALLDLYRLAWDLSDVAAFVSQFRRQHDDSDDNRKTWTGLRGTCRALADRRIA